MSQDLSRLLQEWPYDPEHTVRIVAAEDGRTVMQVRLPLGIEQYELEGRPDGERPFGYDTAVAALEDRLSRHVEEHGSDEGFTIDHEDATVLHNEGVLFYYRYLLLFQENDFARTTRDTEHNLRLCNLLERYCPDEEDRNAVLQFKPYIVRMNAMARAMTALRKNMGEVARGVLENAVDEIDALTEIDSPAFRFEKVRSTNYLRATLQQIDEGELPAEGEAPFEAPDDVSVGAGEQVSRLEAELQQAVEDENYERAASLRDRIRELGS
jgi:hypothetical protein